LFDLIIFTERGAEDNDGHAVETIADNNCAPSINSALRPVSSRDQMTRRHLQAPSTTNESTKDKTSEQQKKDTKQNALCFDETRGCGDKSSSAYLKHSIVSHNSET
jgi:hypothetical protein